jgi:TP901 family phage tail tape measure protein
MKHLSEMVGAFLMLGEIRAFFMFICREEVFWMANRIKGITIEIGGDTTKLQTALKGVNSNIKYTQSQLKDVEKLLKLDPGNTELLAQKQKLLADAVSETKEKLSTLKTAAEQANMALAGGEISQAQYDALQREIIETENDLKSLEEQANQSATALQKISATGTKFQEVGGQIAGVGKAILPVSVAVTGIGAAGLKVASDFEKAMSGVQAITGATGKDFEKLRETAIDLGASTSFSSGEVAEAMTEMAKAGWSTTQIIDGMSGVLDATAASGENLGSVATIVADAITGFGLTAKDSAAVADLMTQAANSGTIGIGDLGESYKYIAPMAQSMGLSIQDVTTALSAMSMAGIKGSQAGTSLRTVLANMAKPSNTVAVAMDELGICITNSDGSFKSLDDMVKTIRTSFSGLTDDQKAYYATALAGKEGMSGLLSLLNLSQTEYDELSASMNNCSGIAGQTASVMQDNLQSKIEQMGGALESLAIKLADYVIPFLSDLVEKLTTVIDAFTNLSPGIQKAILVIGGIIAVAGPLLIIVGKVISTIGTIMTIVPKVAGVINVVKGAFAALNATMLANPIILIIAAIAALVAAFIYLWNTNEDFRQFWIDLWNNIKEIAVAVWEALKEFFAAAWQAIVAIATSVWNGLASFFTGLWEGIKTVFTTVVTAISTFLSTAWTAIQMVIATVWTAISTFITTIITAIQTFLTTAWNNIKTVISTVLGAIQTVFATVWNAIKTVITTVVNGIKSTITTVWNGIKSTITTMVNAIKTAVSTAFSTMWNGIKTTVSGIYNTIKTGFDNAVNFIKNLASSAFDWGADIISGIVDGIKSCIGKVKDAVKNVADTIKSFLHFSVPDEGPLTDYESWMPDFMEGLAKGIEQSRGLVEKAVSGVAADMMINPKVGTAEFAGASGTDSYSADTGTSIVNAIREAVSGMANPSGDIVIPVYIGGTMLDEVIVTAQQRTNLRSGGR